MKTYKKDLPELSIKYKKGNHKSVQIKSSSDAAEVFKNYFDADTIDYEESVVVIYLNTRNNTIGWFKVSHGGLNGCIVDVRKIFSVALQIGATSLIIAHNHPTGNLKPSIADNQITQKIKEGGKLLDISLLDHIIITSDNGFYSFADNGKI